MSKYKFQEGESIISAAEYGDRSSLIGRPSTAANVSSAGGKNPKKAKTDRTLSAMSKKLGDDVDMDSLTKEQINKL